MDSSTVILFFIRWIHLIAGVTWIGHLYFFNFVNLQAGKVLDGPTKKLVVPQLMPRALWWFRWGAMVTFLSGLAYLYFKYWVYGTGMSGDAGMMTVSRGQWIAWGALLGTVMWFNVWFIIWPSQKKIIRWTKAGQVPPEMAGTVKKAALVSRINTYLSAPMLFAMAAANHLPVSASQMAVWIAVSVAAGFGLIWSLYKISAKAGANFN